MNKDPQPQAVAVRKRQQIQDSAKQMFIWVAAMSAVVGAALVVSWFLWNQIMFRASVISEKNSTIQVLVANNEAVPELRDNLAVLETNTALADSKADDDQRSLQVVLDALPADANSLALGASLQQRLASNVSGLTVESLVVTPTIDEQAGGEDASFMVADGESAEGMQIEVRMSVTASGADSLDELLKRLERSIRVIDVNSLTMDRSQERYSMTLNVHGYYQPAKQVQLGSKVVRP